MSNEYEPSCPPRTEAEAAALNIPLWHSPEEWGRLIAESNQLKAELEQAVKECDEAISLLEQTKSMVMRTEENREWLERRNRLLGWPPLEKYDS